MPESHCATVACWLRHLAVVAALVLVPLIVYVLVWRWPA
jgi:hypothetical protein